MMAERADVEDLDSSIRGEISILLEERNMEFRTKAVEEALTPLIEQVTSLSEHIKAVGSGNKQSPRHGKRGRAPKLSKLIQLVDKATKNFLTVGEEIAQENSEYQEELMLACDEVKLTGETLQTAASTFAKDTLSCDKRSAMVDASRSLLMAVTRLMVIADAADVSKLFKASSQIEEKLRALCAVKTEDELVSRAEECATEISHITQLAAMKQSDLKYEASLQLLVAAQTQLTQSHRMLIGVSKAFLENPELKSAEENRDYVVMSMLSALKTISLLADGEDPENIERGFVKATPGEVAVAFRELENALEQSVIISSLIATEATACCKALQQNMTKILSAASRMASSELTRDYRQHSIITQCRDTKAKLKELIVTCEAVMGEDNMGEMAATIAECVATIKAKSGLIKRELFRALVDHVSDIFIDSTTSVCELSATAATGDSELLQEKVEAFQEDATQMEQAAKLACSLSGDIEAIKLAKLAAKHIRTLRPQVLSAATTLTAKPASKIAQKNMSVFVEAWNETVSLLRDSVDNLVPLLDFIIVTETHVCQDCRVFIQAVESCDSAQVKEAADIVQGRCHRVMHVAEEELHHNPTHYQHNHTQVIQSAVRNLKENSLVHFSAQASKAAQNLSSSEGRVDIQMLDEACQKVMDDVGDIRRSFFETLSANELAFEEELSQIEDLPQPLSRSLTPSVLSQISAGSLSTIASMRKFQRTPQHSIVFDHHDITKAPVAQPPSKQKKAMLAKANKDLSEEKEKFESEVGKWDDTKNDVIVLAKEMCLMVMDMSDFTRGDGALRSTMDVIVTAKDIARAGELLDELARRTADECPDEQCQKDLLAYLDRIKLCSHQLKMASAVKSADLSSSEEETVDAASAMITAAKNLMAAVVQTVKSCYVASAAIARAGGSMQDEVLQWRMTIPKKKKLVPNTALPEPSTSPFNTLPAVRQLAEFHPSWGEGGGAAQL